MDDTGYQKVVENVAFRLQYDEGAWGQYFPFLSGIHRPPLIVRTWGEHKLYRWPRDAVERLYQFLEFIKQYLPLPVLKLYELGPMSGKMRDWIEERLVDFECALWRECDTASENKSA